MNHILFLVPYPLGRAPSQRFRVEAFLSHLEREGIAYRLEPFLNSEGYEVLYKEGATFRKLMAVAKGFMARLALLFRMHKYSHVFIHREAAPLGPPFFEYIIGNLLSKKVIFDFDDAIWIPNVSEANRLFRYLKCTWKVKWICKWSHCIAAGNDYLADYARQYNKSVQVLPTCVDTGDRFFQIKEQHTKDIVVGWTGSHSTLKYLNAIHPVLQRLQEQCKFTFTVICNAPPSFSLPDMKFVKWTEADEIKDLMQFNIGIMPLESDAWSEGKCGFKLIQYLALGIPALASPIGVNGKIVQHAKTGFLCDDDDTWMESLKKLIDDAGLRENMGMEGKRHMEKHYSIQAYKNIFLSLFN